MKILFLLLSFACSFNAFAGQTTTALLRAPITLDSGRLLVSSYGTTSGLAPCAEANQRFAIDGTTPAGKVNVAAILLAYSTGKAVQLVGDGTCSAYPNSETIVQVRFGD